MFYVYLLRTKGIKNKNYYIGCTADLRKRVEEHKKGLVKTTKGRCPELFYYEAFNNKGLAFKREKGLKTSGSVYNALLRRLDLK